MSRFLENELFLVKHFYMFLDCCTTLFLKVFSCLLFMCNINKKWYLPLFYTVDTEYLSTDSSKHLT